MEVLHRKCAGLDVHKDSVVASVRIASEHQVECHLATFGTTTSALLDLGEWLSSYGVTHVAMEATGVYWKPVWHALSGSALRAELTAGEVKDDAFELVLLNAMHIKKVPGRKTDVSGAQWIADLLAHAHANTQAARPRASAARAAHPEDAGGREHQALVGRQRHHRQERARHPRCALEGRD